MIWNNILVCPEDCGCSFDGTCWRDRSPFDRVGIRGSQMRIKALVVGLRTDKWEGKKGERHQDLITVMDLDKENRLDQMVDFVVPDGTDKVPAVDAIVELGVSHIEPAFGGRLRLRGSIIAGK